MPGSVANPGRRRFARAGVGGSAVLGVMLAKPVLASDSVYHCTVSGHVSGNMSRVETDCAQLGRSPAYWLQNLDAWLPDSIFNTNFGGKFFYWSSSEATRELRTVESEFPATLKDVLENQIDSQPFLLGKAAVASLLNATALFDPAELRYPLTETQVKAMFAAVFAGGTYQAVAGANSVQWDANKVTRYLQSLYDQSVSF